LLSAQQSRGLGSNCHDVKRNKRSIKINIIRKNIYFCRPIKER